jgi:hypothetical protein
MAESRETKVRKAAKAKGLQLDKDGKLYRLVDGNGTLVAADWSTGEGLPLADIEKALE